MAFQFSVNQTPINGARAVAQLIALLVTAGWSIHAYGDGSTRTGSGTGFNATKLEDLASSWVAVNAPGSAGSLIFQRSAAGAGNNSSWWVAWAKAGLNTDGNGTTVDTEATASNRQNMWGTIGNTHGSGAATLFPADDALGMARCSCAADDASPAFWLACWNRGTGEARTLLFLDPCTGHASDTAVEVLHADYLNGGPWVGTMDRLANNATAAPFSWHRYGLSGSGWSRTMAPTLGGWPSVVVPRNLRLNPYDGRDELITPVFLQEYSSARWWKGIATMLLWAGYSRATGHTFDPTGAGDDRVVVGDIALPWPAGTAAVV
jgi:hypothetical protein